MYIILGCDDVGSALALQLSKSGEEILVIDNDENALTGLKEANIHSVRADTRTLDFDSLPIKDPVAFILLQKNFDDNLILGKRIKKIFPDKFILSRASNEKETAELLENGVDSVVQTGRIVMHAILN